MKRSPLLALCVLAGCTGFEAEEIPASLGSKPATGVLKIETTQPLIFSLAVLQQDVKCDMQWRADNLAKTMPTQATCSDGRHGKGTVTRVGSYGTMEILFALNDGTEGWAKLTPQ